MLVDNYARNFKYLRLSLTEKCNFKCSYCLPNGYKRSPNKFLDSNEIYNLAAGFKQLGIEKIRLTGGEPTLRADLFEIISLLKNDLGINQVALTTNGFRLEQDLEKLKLAGLDSLNISLDSLIEKKYKEICGVEKCESIKRSIDCALNMGFKTIKLNCVLLKELNDDEFFHFLDYVKDRPIAVRFIELMRTGDNQSYFEKHHLPVDQFERKLLERDWLSQKSGSTSGPAKAYFHNDYLGQIGFISPYSKNFCASCNRLRVSSIGGLRLCLFGQGDISLRDLIQKSEDRPLLKDRITAALGLKTPSHRLHENVFGDMRTLSAIGG